MHFEDRTLALDRIDVADDTFRITTESDVAGLSESIECLGLIHRPILQKCEDKWRIISGFRRIEALSRSGRTRIPCRGVSPDATPRMCAQLAVTENALQRRLNLVEESRAYGLLLAACGGERKKAAESAVLSGLSGNLKYMEKAVRLCGFIQPIQRALIDQELSLPVALEMDGMRAADAAALTDLITTLKLGLNKQRQLIEYIFEISKKEERCILEILHDPDFAPLVGNKDLDKGFKRQELFMRLKKRRFPELSAAESMFRTRMKRLALDPAIQIIPPKYFEGTQYTFSIQFENIEDFNERLKRIDELKTHPDFLAILEKR